MIDGPPPLELGPAIARLGMRIKAKEKMDVFMGLLVAGESSCDQTHYLVLGLVLEFRSIPPPRL